MPVHGAGEVIGQLLDRGCSAPELLLLAVTPGLAGALEDVAGALEALLRPHLLVGGAVAWLAAAGTAPPPGAPAIAAWALAGVTAVARRSGDGPPTLHVAVDDHPPAGGQLAGPTTIGSEVAGSGTVTLDLHGPGLRAVRDDGLRPLGREVGVDHADGRVLHRLDGHPAADCLVELARDGMPAGDLPHLGRGLHAEAGGLRAAVLGRQRGGSGLVLDRALPPGAPVRFLVPDGSGAARRLAGAGASGALGFGPPALGRRLAGPGGAWTPSGSCWLAPACATADEGGVAQVASAAIAISPTEAGRRAG